MACGSRRSVNAALALLPGGRARPRRAARSAVPEPAQRPRPALVANASAGCDSSASARSSSDSASASPRSRHRSSAVSSTSSSSLVLVVLVLAAKRSAISACWPWTGEWTGVRPRRIARGCSTNSSPNASCSSSRGASGRLGRFKAHVVPAEVLEAGAALAEALRAHGRTSGALAGEKAGREGGERLGFAAIGVPLTGRRRGGRSRRRDADWPARRRALRPGRRTRCGGNSSRAGRKYSPTAR